MGFNLNIPAKSFVVNNFCILWPTLSSILRSYGVKTGRTLVPVARLAEYFVPGAKIAADALELSSDYLDQAIRHPTTAETKAEISRRISKLGISFIIILDDLDRLEPTQAVEVVRLVRSVADFPNVTYLMCYDREILSHALSTGLNLSDGDQYLQKIVQLTFTVPLPEPFDLRKNFLEHALEIFSNVTLETAKGEMLDDLKRAVSCEGAGLRTPREVKLALNGIRFIYPAVFEDVYFPDLCRLHLIKTVNPRLYKWLEEYLSVHSVLATRDAYLRDGEKAKLGEQLGEILPSDDADSIESIGEFERFIPGVIASNVAKDRVFNSTSMVEVHDLVTKRRLGSPIHYRYYFALTAPKTVIPEKEFSRILVLAREVPNELTSELSRLASERRISGRTWFEHILDRLDSDRVAALDAPTVYGLVVAISDAMDAVLKIENQPRPFSVSIDRIARGAVESCLLQLRSVDKNMFISAAEYLATQCVSINWTVGTFFRDQIWSHGLVGDQEKPPENWIFTSEELEKLLLLLRDIVAKEETQDEIDDLPDVASYLFGWKDLSGQEAVRNWAKKFTESDEGFLGFLDHLRSWAMSDRVYHPLQESSVSAFLDWNLTLKRLKNLKNSKFNKKVAELEMAIQQSRH